jgi:hypothetical protein
VDGGQVRSAIARMRGMIFDLLVLSLAITVPLTVLTFDLSKSPVVGGIVTVPCVLIFVLFASAFTAAPHEPAQDYPLYRYGVRRLEPHVRRSLLVGCVVVAMAMFLAKGTSPLYDLSRGDLGRINNLNKAIAGYIVDNALGQTSISFDRIVEYLNAGTIELYGYESWRQMISVAPKLGGDIFATPRAAAVRLWQESDIVVMTDSALGREYSHYPMDSEIRSYWGEMWQWTNANLALLYTTEINGIPYRVFHKPFVKVEGGSAEWITSRGLRLTVDRSELRRWPFVVLEGENNNEILGGAPRPRAIYASEGEAAIELPVAIETSGEHYRLVIDAREAAGPSGVVKVQLTFDRYFIPKERGINEDSRQLVMKVPTSKVLRESDRVQ